jgi:hypothetical protein
LGRCEDVDVVAVVEEVYNGGVRDADRCGDRVRAVGAEQGAGDEAYVGEWLAAAHRPGQDAAGYRGADPSGGDRCRWDPYGAEIRRTESGPTGKVPGRDQDFLASRCRIGTQHE